jgi:uncharacterized membrane protein YeaQ/YmgE (transglycosylase-associated protein family)
MMLHRNNNMEKKMTLLDFLLLLIIAGICGAIAQVISGYSSGGCLFSIAVGFVGALIGAWVARSFALPRLFMLRVGTTAFPVVWSIIGAALLLAVIKFFSRSRRQTR